MLLQYCVIYLFFLVYVLAEVILGFQEGKRRSALCFIIYSDSGQLEILHIYLRYMRRTLIHINTTPLSMEASRSPRNCYFFIFNLEKWVYDLLERSRVCYVHHSRYHPSKL